MDAKVADVRKDLAKDTKIDPDRLRQAVMDDLMQDKLMGWLEENSTLTEQLASNDDKAEASQASAKKPAAKKTAAKSKADPED